jgi:hypothetical protein
LIVGILVAGAAKVPSCLKYFVLSPENFKVLDVFTLLFSTLSVITRPSPGTKSVLVEERVNYSKFKFSILKVLVFRYPV